MATDYKALGKRISNAENKLVSRKRPLESSLT